MATDVKQEQVLKEAIGEINHIRFPARKDQPVKNVDPSRMHQVKLGKIGPIGKMVIESGSDQRAIALVSPAVKRTGEIIGVARIGTAQLGATVTTAIEHDM